MVDIIYAMSDAAGDMDDYVDFARITVNEALGGD